MVKPAEMTKLSVTGPKSQLQTVIDTLHKLELLDIEEYDGELDTGEPFEEAEELSQVLVDVRSLLSKLPETEASHDKDLALDDIQDDLPEIAEDIERLEERKNNIEKELSGLKDQKRFFGRLRGSELTYEDLKGTQSLEVFVGKIDTEELRERVVASFEIFHGEETDVVFYREKDTEEVEETLRDAKQEEYSLVETGFSGTAEEIIQEIDDRAAELEEDKEEIKEEFDEIADEWRGRLESAEEFLTEKVEKSEAPIKFAATKRTFIAEGWVPSEDMKELRERLMQDTEGKVHIEEEEGDSPPVKHENNRLVQPFEDLTDLVAVPRYNELDPSFALFLTFPLFFGFMIGDAGYGLTSLIVFYAGYRMFPAASNIFRSLMWASAATIFFGLIYGDAFGFLLFGHHSDLAAVTGIHLFEKIPIIFHRAEHLSQVFVISAAIGLVHVNFGYLLGFYNEYVNHGVVEAFLEKGSWLLLQTGFLIWYLYGFTAGAPVVVISAVLLYLGEGIEGVVEIPSLLSNVLSYLRIFGVSVAAISLAKTVNAIAHPLFATGTAWGLVAGTLFLMLGHTFNTFIKIMEGFLQGIRLHYVEMFSKFYEGGGKKYAPFGARST